MNKITIAILTATVLLLNLQATRAGSATWNLNPTSGDWSTAGNWTPATVPNGPGDTAAFALSNVANLSVTAATQVNSIMFDAGSSAYTITSASFANLTISGEGIINDSGVEQSFFQTNGGLVTFSGNATAGNQAIFTNTGVKAGDAEAGAVIFTDHSNAGHATFVNLPAEQTFFGAHAGQMAFFDHSTAGNGTFVCNGSTDPGALAAFVAFTTGSSAANGTFILNGTSVAGGNGGYMTLFLSGAGNATITVNGATVQNAGRGHLQFLRGSRAENATLIANGGSNGGNGGIILFQATSKGNNARVELFDDGTLDVSGNNAHDVGIGSIEGNGLVNLGRHDLIVGSNNLNTTFGGTIRDLGTGSLTKVGSGKLVFTSANKYAGGTTIEDGTLVTNNLAGSGTGFGPVQVTRGKLGGRGTISGVVTIGSGSGFNASLSPGKNDTSIGGLNILDSLTFNSDGTYNCQVDSDSSTADSVTASGVTINSGALFSGNDLGANILPAGTNFTAIQNTAVTPITGTFANLGDGATIVIGNSTFQANYEGGDGNDLTLTVL